MSDTWKALASGTHRLLKKFTAIPNFPVPVVFKARLSHWPLSGMCVALSPHPSPTCWQPGQAEILPLSGRGGVSPIRALWPGFSQFLPCDCMRTTSLLCLYPSRCREASSNVKKGQHLGDNRYVQREAEMLTVL